ncbi:hypothetical protein BT93_D0006 [Corymbia citriodora subsp. variegata]|nr:hypothetical protein BT93_D0006 [Corymbia citriodora subsp. variegata]
MAEWSQMPEELLRLIVQHLNSQFDVLRFRSVCSSWRSSVTAPSPSPFWRGGFPIILKRGGGSFNATWKGFLFKHTILLIGVPRSCDQTVPVPTGWLVKIREDVPRGMSLLNPLSLRTFPPLAKDSPMVLDLMNLRVLELGHEYVLEQLNCPLNIFSNHDLFMKTVFMSLDNGNDFALLRIAEGELVMFKSREKRWFPIQDMRWEYDDVILFKGEFYAVDHAGNIWVVGLDLGVTLIVQLYLESHHMFLVESVGELLLVYSESVYWDNGDGDFSELQLRIKVYKLDMDREEKAWNEVKDLGDRVLFLGDKCAFSASAADLGGACRGNCIIFMDPFKPPGASRDVYHTDSPIIGPIEACEGYSELFWPAPDWIASRMRTTQEGIQDKLMELRIDSVPRLHFFSKGQKVDEIVGADIERLKHTMDRLYK